MSALEASAMSALCTDTSCRPSPYITRTPYITHAIHHGVHTAQACILHRRALGVRSSGEQHRRVGGAGGPQLHIEAQGVPG